MTDFTITARLALRYSGVDTDVSIRCDDPTTPLNHYLVYAPSGECKELVPLDGWSGEVRTADAPVSVFASEAGDCLKETPLGAGNLGDVWTIDASLAQPGHELHNNSWDSDSDSETGPNYTCCAFPLKRKSDGDVYFETAIVGGLVVRVDFWIALKIT